MKQARTETQSTCIATRTSRTQHTTQNDPHRWRAVSTQKLYTSGISEDQLHPVKAAGKLVQDPLFIGLVLRHKGGRKTDIIADIIEGNC